jgi:deoxyribodipyrimidine photo-lyase
VQFIHQSVRELKEQLIEIGSDLIVQYGQPLDVFQRLSKALPVSGIYANHDYEPAARERDQNVGDWAKAQGVEFKTFKDQCIFEKEEVLTDSGKPYTVFTPYKKKWLSLLESRHLQTFEIEAFKEGFARRTEVETSIQSHDLAQSPSLRDLGFQSSEFQYPSKTVSRGTLKNYARDRDFPAL